MFLKPEPARVLLQNTSWIILALLFFLVGVFASTLFGGSDSFVTDFTESQQPVLQKAAEIVFEGPPLQGIAFLIINNLLASLLMLLLGAMLGLPTMLGLFFNGALLGSAVTMLGREGVPILNFLLLGVLPHGIFELPAFFTCAALGLKLGFHLLFPLPSKNRRESIKFIWKEFTAVFPLVIMLIITAAVIEVMVTPVLLVMFAGL